MRPLFQDEIISPSTVPSSIQNSQIVDTTSISPIKNNVVEKNPAPILEQITDAQIDQLGDQSSSQLASFSQKILNHVKASDADGFGSKLNELVGVAKDLNPTAYSKNGILQKFTSFFGSAKEKMLSKYSSVESRMNSLIRELDKSTALHTKRIADLEEMYNANVATHKGLQIAAEEGQRLINILSEQLNQEETATDTFAAQRIYETKSKIERLEKRVDDLNRAMLLSKQMAPEIRLLQDNSRTLATKFKDVKAVTIPAWKNAFTLFIVQMEQKKGAELANAVHDATDEAFRLQADLLRSNAQEIAKAKQRSVVSIETLQHVQEQLLATFDDMGRIAEEGRRARQEAAPKLLALEQELIQRFSQKSLN